MRLDWKRRHDRSSKDGYTRRLFLQFRRIDEFEALYVRPRDVVDMLMEVKDVGRALSMSAFAPSCVAAS
jgi:hypothetical protein